MTNEINSRCYIVLNRELNMPVGKAAVQVGHAMDLVYDRISEAVRLSDEDCPEEYVHCQRLREWRKAGRKKVLLGVKSDAELQKYIDKLREVDYVVLEIVDNGINFFDGPTRTGFVVLPQLQDIPELKRVQVYK